MKPSRAIRPITYLKTNSAKLIASINSNREPVIITQNGEAMAVIQDIRTYERDRETLLMLKLLSQGVAAAEKRDFMEQEKVFEQMGHHIAILNKKNHNSHKDKNRTRVGVSKNIVAETRRKNLIRF